MIRLPNIENNVTTATTRVLVAQMVTVVLLGMIKYLTGVRAKPVILHFAFALTLLAIIFRIMAVAGATKTTLGCQY